LLKEKSDFRAESFSYIKENNCNFGVSLFTHFFLTMKKIFLLYLVSLICLSPLLKAQKVSNVKAELDKFNQQIIITYDLENTHSKFDKYVVELYLSTDSGKTFSKEKLLYVSGDVGKGKVEGLEKHIQWFYLNESISFDGKNISFKVKSFLDEDAFEKRLASLKRESAAINSLLIPGWGDYKVRSGKNYWWIGAITYGLIGSGTYLHFRAKDNYRSYENANNIADGNSFLNHAQDQNKLSKILIGAGAACWLADVIAVWLKGKKNRITYQEILDKKLKNKKKNAVLLDWNFQTQFQYTQIGLSLKF
jgi:hypothetical protein